MCKKLGYTTTRNHAIRKYVNSFVLNKLGLSVEEKAALLGHSVEVNLRNYTFEEKDLCNRIISKINAESEEAKQNFIKSLKEAKALIA